MNVRGRVWGSALLIAAGSALLGGCMGGSLPPTHYYTLRPAGDGSAAGGATEAADGWRVGVDSIAVDPPYDQDRLVYRSSRDPSEVGFYYYHRWASPLGRLLQVALVDSLASVEGIRSIEPVSSGVDYDGRLGGRLLVLEEFDSAEGQEVRLTLELALRDAEGDPVWSETLSETASGRMEDVAGVAELARRAVDQALRRAADGLGPALTAYGVAEDDSTTE